MLVVEYVVDAPGNRVFKVPCIGKSIGSLNEAEKVSTKSDR